MSPPGPNIGNTPTVRLQRMPERVSQRLHSGDLIRVTIHGEPHDVYVDTVKKRGSDHVRFSRLNIDYVVFDNGLALKELPPAAGMQAGQASSSAGFPSRAETLMNFRSNGLLYRMPEIPWSSERSNNFIAASYIPPDVRTNVYGKPTIQSPGILMDAANNSVKKRIYDSDVFSALYKNKSLDDPFFDKILKHGPHNSYFELRRTIESNPPVYNSTGIANFASNETLLDHHDPSYKGIFLGIALSEKPTKSELDILIVKLTDDNRYPELEEIKELTNRQLPPIYILDSDAGKLEELHIGSRRRGMR